MIIPIILAGGSGSRLWPLSREHYPKQLLSLIGKYSLLQETVKRSQNIPFTQDPIIICNKEHQFLITEQMEAIGIKKPLLILESVGRNTAPAIAIAAHIAQTQHPNQEILLLVLPADHLIQDLEIFTEQVSNSTPLAEQGYLNTFGITPSYAETGYGYIKAGKMRANNIYEIAEFVEKPPLAKAEVYLKDGAYYWNSGIFLLNSKTYLDELKKYRPDIATICATEVNKLTHIKNFYHLSKDFSNCPSESIDYAVMEKTHKALISPLPIRWSDVGSWSALFDILPKNAEGNIIQGDVTSIDVKNCYIRAEHRLVAVAGLNDHIVVETQDAVMITHKDYAQKVKDLFHNLKLKARNEIVEHRIVNRPWGTYEVLIEGPQYRVKHVIIKPGHSLSNQRHQHRSEHWVVLKGTATVNINNTQKILQNYESTFIAMNQEHQLSNQNNETLEIIEIQTGTYVGEDDIQHPDDKNKNY